MLLRKRATAWRARIRRLGRLAGRRWLSSRLGSWRTFAGARRECGRALGPLTLLRRHGGMRLRTVIRAEKRSTELQPVIRRIEPHVRSAVRAQSGHPSPTEPRKARHSDAGRRADHRTHSIFRTHTTIHRARVETRLRPLVLRERIDRASTRSERAVERIVRRVAPAPAAPPTAPGATPNAPPVVRV